MISKKRFILNLILFCIVLFGATTYSSSEGWLMATRQEGKYDLKWIGFDTLLSNSSVFKGIEDHSKLSNLDYNSSGHTGFMSDFGDAATGDYTFNESLFRLNKIFHNTNGNKKHLFITTKIDPSEDQIDSETSLYINTYNESPNDIGIQRSLKLYNYIGGTGTVFGLEGINIELKNKTSDTVAKYVTGININTSLTDMNGTGTDRLRQVANIKSVLNVDNCSTSPNIFRTGAGAFANAYFETVVPTLKVKDDGYFPIFRNIESILDIQDSSVHGGFLPSFSSFNSTYFAGIERLEDTLLDSYPPTRLVGFHVTDLTNNYSGNNTMQIIGVLSDIHEHGSKQLRNVSGWFINSPLIVGKNCQVNEPGTVFRSEISSDGDFGVTNDAEIGNNLWVGNDLIVDGKLTINGGFYSTYYYDVSDTYTKTGTTEEQINIFVNYNPGVTPLTYSLETIKFGASSEVFGVTAASPYSSPYTIMVVGVGGEVYGTFRGNLECNYVDAAIASGTKHVEVTTTSDNLGKTVLLYDLNDDHYEFNTFDYNNTGSDMYLTKATTSSFSTNTLVTITDSYYGNIHGSLYSSPVPSIVLRIVFDNAWDTAIPELKTSIDFEFINRQAAP